MGTTTELTGEVAVDASVETVWRAVTDWERQGDWMLGTSVRVTAGDGSSVSFELAATTGVGPLGFTDTMEIVGWDPPHRCTVRHTGRVVRGSGVFRVRPQGEGSVLSWTEQLELPFGAQARGPARGPLPVSPE